MNIGFTKLISGVTPDLDTQRENIERKAQELKIKIDKYWNDRGQPPLSSLTALERQMPGASGYIFCVLSPEDKIIAQSVSAISYFWPARIYLLQKLVESGATAYFIDENLELNQNTPVLDVLKFCISKRIKQGVSSKALIGISRLKEYIPFMIQDLKNGVSLEKMAKAYKVHPQTLVWNIFPLNDELFSLYKARKPPKAVKDRLIIFSPLLQEYADKCNFVEEMVRRREQKLLEQK